MRGVLEAPSPALAGRGLGEGLARQASTRGEPPHPALRADVSPRAGPGDSSNRAASGLESVKKTDQVAGVGQLPGSIRQRPDGISPTSVLTTLGYVIDDGPGNEAPRDAGCG